MRGHSVSAAAVAAEGLEAVVITEAEILEALRESMQRQDADGFTSQDLGDVLGITQGHAREYLRRLSRNGKVVHAGTRAGTTVDGRVCRSPVYRLTSLAAPCSP